VSRNMRGCLVSYRCVEWQRYRTARFIAARLSLVVRRAAPARLSDPDGTSRITQGVDRLAVQLWPHFQPDRDCPRSTSAEVFAVPAVMSAWGKKRTWRWTEGMSAFPPKADIQ